MQEHTNTQMKDVFELMRSKCYRCNGIMRYAAHRIGAIWFCSSCFYNMDKDTIQLYATHHQPEQDFDLQLKDSKQDLE